MSALPAFRKQDVFRRRPNQAMVDASNELSSISTGDTLESHRTPMGSGIVDPSEGEKTPVARFKVTTVLDPVALPYLTKAQVWDGSIFLSDELVIRTSRLFWQVDDELLAVTPVGGVTSINGAEAVDGDGAPVIWQELSGESDGLAWGKVKTYTGGSNTVTLTPCDKDGTVAAPPPADVDVSITLPTSRSTCSFFGGEVDDVLAYFAKDGVLWLASVPMPTSTTKYDVFQVTATSGQGGFDSVRVK